MNIPPHLTSTTGIDTLTHVIEAYIGKSNTTKIKRCSQEAIVLIFENLYQSYLYGKDINVHAKIQKAAYVAGVAFTRAYVGNVHAIAHT